MERIAIIDETFDGSHGKIAKNLMSNMKRKGFIVSFYYGRGPKNVGEDMYRIGNKSSLLAHALLSRLTGLQGYFSNYHTSKLIKSIKDSRIDTVICLNLHGYYLNEGRFLSFISKEKIRLVYIMADEYPYLGKCAVSPICQNYLTGKGKCPDIRRYPASWFFDTCSLIIKNKEKQYKTLDRTVFVGPEFVVNNAKKSYLGKYMKTAVLDEAIDTDIYSPQDTSSLREKLNISPETKVILCVAPSSKGVKYFELLSERFIGNTDYLFIHIGSGDDNSHDNYLHIGFIKENSDLAKYYSLADLLVFTSLADTMSNTCLESLSCGTPLLVFDISGMPYLLDETVGVLVPPKDVDAMFNVVSNTKKKNIDTINQCREYALKRYSSKEYSEKVINIAMSIE